MEATEDVSTYLCYYDMRNKDGFSQFKEEKELYGFDDDDFKDLGDFAKENCSCDNCFYGRHKLADIILKQQVCKLHAWKDLAKLAIHHAKERGLYMYATRGNFCGFDKELTPEEQEIMNSHLIYKP